MNHRAYALILLFVAYTSLPATERIVKPGDDLAAAVQELRQQPRPAVLLLGDGEHRLTKPLLLTAADGQLTIQPVQGAKPRIVGSLPITDWRQVDAARNLWEANLPMEATAVRAMFVAGERWQRCRTPNDRWLETTEKLPVTKPFAMSLPKDLLRKEWAEQRNVSVRLIQKWAGFMLPVQAVDLEAGTVSLSGQLHAHRQEKNNRFWLENSPEFLDAPREWFADSATKTVRLIAPAGVDLRKVPVTTAVAASFIRIDGAKNITLRGLTFAECSDDFPAAGEIDPQAAISRRGAVHLTGAENCRIEQCVVENVGGYAIDIGENSRDCHISRCELRNLGAGGVRIGETNPNTKPTARNVVEDCLIRNFGQLYPGAVGIIVLQSAENQIRHNEIKDGNYTGISVGWTWGYRESPCRANLIEANHLHHLGGPLMSDLGGVYLLGPQPGTVVRGNVVHDVDCFEYGAWGLYTDEGSSEILLEGNCIYRCRRAGFHQHYGKNNVFRNNLIVACGEGGVRRTREEEHLSFTFEQNVVVNETPQFAHSSFKNGKYLFRKNVYFATHPGAAKWGGQSWEQWQKSEQDAESLVADPLLVDLLNPQLGLKAESPAFRLGYMQLKLSDVGPRVKIQ